MRFKQLPLLVPMLVFAGCNSTGTTTAVATQSATATYAAADVAKHNTRSDCWIIYQNSVYDVTKFGPQHPGGDKIYDGCGQDITTFMNTDRKPIS